MIQIQKVNVPEQGKRLSKVQPPHPLKHGHLVLTRIHLIHQFYFADYYFQIEEKSQKVKGSQTAPAKPKYPRKSLITQ